MAKQEKEKVPIRTETIESFIARGGTVKKLEVVSKVDKNATVACTYRVGQNAIMTYEEADLVYGEPDRYKKQEIKTKKSKKKNSINFNALPPELREREIQKMRERLYAQADEEFDEEEYDPDNMQI